MHMKWPAQKANEWYEKLPWLVGCNFIPSTAVNQLEMWQAQTFDPVTIDRELEWAASLGMNSARVYLHDVAWTIDPDGFKNRVGQFLSIAARHKIRSTLVLFDDCWYPDPKPGKQPDPKPGQHNSMWLQSPGKAAAQDISEQKRLEAYVSDVVGTFGQDERVLMWDIYNELGNIFLDTLSLPVWKRMPKLAMLLFRHLLLPIPTLPLFCRTIQWVRNCSPSQPITAAVWIPFARQNKLLIEASDIVTFHNYKDAKNLARQIKKLKSHGRPVMCTEYIARCAGSLFETCLPVMKKEKVGCYNWGLVSGRTQTIYSWADRGKDAEPAIWYHDIFRKDGTPFSEAEVSVIRKLTGVNKLPEL